MEGDTNLPAQVDSPPAPAVRPLSDMRSKLTQLPVESQTVVLGQFEAQRKNFRDWLLSQLKEGVHFGHPPGTLPVSRVNTRGEREYRSIGRNRQEVWISEKQWRPKPSLYKAGADFIIELMCVRDTYQPDAQVWQMMGAKSNEVCIRCELYDRVSGEKLADGHGYGSRGDRDDYDGKSANTALKMASKRAKVAAVINAFGLSDLFTQDVEDGEPRKPEDLPEVTNPVQSADAPKEVKPRNDGRPAPGPRQAEVGVDKVRSIWSRWKRVAEAECKNMGEVPNVTKEAFVTWLAKMTEKEASEQLLTGELLNARDVKRIEKSLAADEEAWGL